MARPADRECGRTNVSGPEVTINYRVMLALAALFMALLAIATALQGYFEHGYVVVAFQFVAASLLLYWAIF